MNHLSIHEHIFPSDVRIHMDRVFVNDFDDSQIFSRNAILVYYERIARGVQVGCVKVRKGDGVRRDSRLFVNV